MVSKTGKLNLKDTYLLTVESLQNFIIAEKSYGSWPGIEKFGGSGGI